MPSTLPLPPYDGPVKREKEGPRVTQGNSSPSAKTWPLRAVPDDFAKQIHDRLSTDGDAIVLTDKPGKVCYVAVLENRDVPTDPSESASWGPVEEATWT